MDTDALVTALLVFLDLVVGLIDLIRMADDGPLWPTSQSESRVSR